MSLKKIMDKISSFNDKMANSSSKKAKTLGKLSDEDDIVIKKLTKSTTGDVDIKSELENLEKSGRSIAQAAKSLESFQPMSLILSQTKHEISNVDGVVKYNFEDLSSLKEIEKPNGEKGFIVSKKDVSNNVVSKQKDEDLLDHFLNDLLPKETEQKEDIVQKIIKKPKNQIKTGSSFSMRR